MKRLVLTVAVLACGVAAAGVRAESPECDGGAKRGEVLLD